MYLKIKQNLTSIFKVKYSVLEYELNCIEIPTYKMELFLFPSSLTGQRLLGSVYTTLYSIPEFNEVVGNKIILLGGCSEDQWFTIGKSFIVNEDTSCTEFINYYLKSLQDLSNKAYPIEILDLLTVKVRFELKSEKKDSLRKSDNPQDKYHTIRLNKSGLNKNQVKKYSTNSNSIMTDSKNREVLNKFRIKNISLLKPVNNFYKNLGTIDIETIVINKKLIPYAVGYFLVDCDTNKEKSKIFFLSDYGNKNNIEEASQKMMISFVQEFSKNAGNYHIYVHNLGSFDGYLLIKSFYKVLGKHDMLMDKSKSIISIELPDKISIRDSLRIFPSSLADLSKQFKIPNPKIIFDHEKVTIQKIFEDLEFRKELEHYLYLDLKSLFQVMLAATKLILQKYNVDLSKVYSTSSLAMRIFRTKFLKDPIPLLPKHVDTFVRNSYRGGATDVYKCVGENLYYYDVNSLYPYAIKNPMPYEFLGVQKNFDLDNFFGFVYAKIYIPFSEKPPVLPWLEAKTSSLLYPRGTFTGHFFSEELKAVKTQLGYKITCYVGYEFSQKVLFDEYVDHFYKAKAETTGSEKFINKLFLNGLYGFFGRSLDRWNVEFIPNNQIFERLSVYPAHHWVDLDDKMCLLLRDEHPSKELLKIQNKSFKDFYRENKSFNYPKTTLTNVAIASAITSYARIHMLPIKTDINNPCFYSDTDSVFTQFPLSKDLVGPELGKFKDELKGDSIIRAIFLNNKFYGYETSTQSKVVIAGCPTKQIPTKTKQLEGKITIIEGYKTSEITFEELIDIKNGKTIIKERNNCIVKSFYNLSLFSVSNKISIKHDLNNINKIPIFNKNKELIAYEPIYIYASPKTFSLQKILNKFTLNLKKLKNTFKNLNLLHKLP